MDISEVKKHIKEKTFDSIYIFHGEEHTVMKEYLKKMADVGKMELTYVNSIFDLVSQSKVKSLIPTKHLYVIVDDKDYLTNDKLWAFKGVKDAVVVFYYSTTDGRLKFWKNYKDRAVEFTKLTDDMLVKYIQKKIALTDKNCYRLIDACEHDYGRILLEIDKIQNFMVFAEFHQYDCTTDEAVDVLFEDGTIYTPPHDAIFDFVGAFLDREPITAFRLLEECYSIGEPPLRLLLVMYNNTRTLLMIQSSGTTKGLGLNGFQIKNVIDYKGRYANGELVKILKLIREAEKGIKVGTMPAEYSVESIMVRVM